MKHKYLKHAQIIVISIILSVSVLTGCFRREAQPREKSEILLGTLCTLIIHDHDVKQKHFNSVFERVREIEYRMTLLSSSSEIAEINSMAGIRPVKVSSDTFYVIKRGVEYGKLTDSIFDISIGPLVRLWGIGEKDEERASIPDYQDIKNMLTLVDYRGIVLDPDNETVFLKIPEMVIDLGGIAKGYAVDEAYRILSSYGIKHAIINFGGDIRLIGTRGSGENWRIGIQNPVDFSPRNYLGIISLSEKSIVTSGDYERFFISDNERFHHILDVSTGYPSQSGLKSVTIVSDYAIDGDVLSTAVFIMGLEKGLEFINNNNGIDAIFVTDNNDVYISSYLNSIFQLTGSGFEIREAGN